MKKKAVCFVDDEPDEIRRFREYLAGRFMIGAGSSPDQALQDLRHQGRKKPDLFLLDLYFPDDGPLTADQIEQIHKERLTFLKAQAKYRSVLSKIGQTSSGGFRIARDLRSRSRVAISFFTRKGTLDDAISAYEEHGAISVIKKPDPDPSQAERHGIREAYDLAFKDAAELKAAEIERAIRRSSWWGKHSQTIVGFVMGILTGLVARLIWVLVAGWWQGVG